MDFTSSLAQHLSSSEYIVALIGAGLSAPSGIPTFRGVSSSGLDTAWYATRAAYQQHPEAVWQYYNERRQMAYHALPNSAHYALARLARLHYNFLAITQNVDGLSQRAGHFHRIAELHGSLFSTKCSNDACNLALSLDESQPPEPEGPRPCPACGNGLLRPGIVRFGDPLPRCQLEIVEQWFDSAPRVDLMLVIGTSARVFPAAEYIHRAREKGAFIAHFNLERDDDFTQPGDWFVPGDVAVTLPTILREAYPLAGYQP